MNERPADLSRFSDLSPCLSLGEACRKAGEDEGGRRCILCPLRELCRDESRWLVRRTPRPL